MRTLIIQLPTEPPSPSLAYAHAMAQAQAKPNAQPLSLQWAVASLLPAPDRQTETVVLVPAAALSWHRADLPPGLHKQAARLQAALHGLLEDRLLDDPSQLHMALQPGWKDTPRPWVAVCQRAWLAAHLQALEQAGLTVHRIVPELAPPAPGMPAQVLALGNTDTGWLWVSHSERGVWGLPLNAVPGGPNAWGLSEAELQDASLQAEPGAVAWANEHLGPRTRLMSPGQHGLAAIAADWDLAQFEFRANAQSRQLKNWQRSASNFWHSPAWRPARWGLWVLLLGQLMGLNAWAWKTRTDWQAQQNNWTQMLRESFPQTPLVIDAPLQMAQQVERLRSTSGQWGPADLEAMLSALGQALPESTAAPQQWRYQTGELRLVNFQANASALAAMTKTLSALGYQWRADGADALMTVNPKATP